jgi:iron complex transport system ATP-binding protein
LLAAEQVRFGFPKRPDFLGPVSVSIAPSEFWAIVGPNGAGKSTLLRLLAGLSRPHAGRVLLSGADLAALPARSRARRLAYVPQQPPTDLDLSVRDIVLMGRFPHRSMGLFESAEDHRVAEQAMETTQTSAFADRAMKTLSGGESQLVHLAAGLAQEPVVLLLDEPTASLDLRHQQALFGILKERVASQALAVIVVTHDVNLAASFCSHVLLLHEGAVVLSGPPSRVVSPDVLTTVYGVDLVSLYLPDDPGRRWVVPVSSFGEANG